MSLKVATRQAPVYSSNLDRISKIYYKLKNSKTINFYSNNLSYNANSLLSLKEFLRIEHILK